MTILNDASEVYVGAAKAQRIYLGSNLIWPVPWVVDSFGRSTGIVMNLTGVKAGDLQISAVTTGLLTFATGPAGYTQLGAGGISDPTGTTNDCTMLLFAKVAAADNEQIPANTGGRTFGVAIRDVDTAEFFANLNILYDVTPGTNYVWPALTTRRNPSLVLGISRRTGTGQSVIPNMTQLDQANPGSAEMRVASTSFPVASYPGGITSGIGVSSGRVAAVLEIPGKIITP